MSRKSGHRFSDKDMRKIKEARALKFPSGYLAQEHIALESKIGPAMTERYIIHP
jgi:hypothetical protein